MVGRGDRSRKMFVFLNCNAARHGRVGGKALPEGYTLTARFFASGIMDRTKTLDQGFEYEILDPIPAFSPEVMAFGDVCDTVAAEILDEAEARNLPVVVLWSGGIDSTVALTALLRQTSKEERRARLRVALSVDSIAEFPSFYHAHIHGKLKTIPVEPPLSSLLSSEQLTITGELGDQLFGSDKAKEAVQNGLAFHAWKDVMPMLATKTLGSASDAEKMLAYLTPQIAAAPVKIDSAYSMFWWMNFSLKWQQVALRIPVFARTEIASKLETTRAFFRDQRFQAWALATPVADKIGSTWSSYKGPAKAYIHAFHADDGYRDFKEKEPSLRSVIVNREGRGKRRVRVYMTSSFRPKFKVFEKKSNKEWAGV